MKHAFSWMKSLIIQLLAYVLCTLCKGSCITVKGRGNCVKFRIKICSPGTECCCEQEDDCNDKQSD